MDYRRVWQPGGTYFFTLVLAHRHGNDLLVRHIEALRKVVRHVRERHPFAIHAWVVLPEHLHCVIELPAGDQNFATRWLLIKAGFSKSIPPGESCSRSRQRRAERGIWQRRYWEHLIRDQDDFNAHVDYAHLNPLKHGLVSNLADWPYSTFHRMVAAGRYSPDFAGAEAGPGELNRDVPGRYA